MKMNKDLLNICYKFFNRFITSEELLKQLKDLKKNKETDEIISNVARIIKEVPNIEDEFVKAKKEKMETLMGKLAQVPEDEEEFEFINKSLNNLKKESKKEIDCHERWFKIVDYINENDYFNKCFDSLSDYELLEFICQNIQAPFPPQIDNETFNKLVKVAIEKDEREYLWRLAFNYENSDFDFEQIADYYLKVKDGYYLAEFIDILGERLDIEKIIDRVNDKKMIEDLIAGKSFLKKYITEEQFDKLNKKIS